MLASETIIFLIFNLNLVVRVKSEKELNTVGFFTSAWGKAGAITARSFMPQHLSLPSVITFLNIKFRALKLQFLKILPYHVKDHAFKKF